jgi:hypothetical protein
MCVSFKRREYEGGTKERVGGRERRGTAKYGDDDDDDGDGNSNVGDCDDNNDDDVAGPGRRFPSLQGGR